MTGWGYRGVGCQLAAVFMVTMKVKIGFACQLWHGRGLEESEPEEEKGGSLTAVIENRGFVW